MTFKIELGSKVKDRISGFVGIVYARTEWMYGCRRYTVQPQELKDGRPVESVAFDEDQLEVLEVAKSFEVRIAGGDRTDVRPRADVAR
jgi:hypothetical protein